MAMFSLKQDIEDFKKSSGISKVGLGALITFKATTNVMGYLASETAKSLLRNHSEKMSPAQKARAQEIVNKNR